MHLTPRALAIVAVALGSFATAAQAQSGSHASDTTYRARLTPVPVESSTVASITGSGVVTATLTGTRLSLSGMFAGMKSAATIGQIHLGPKGVRGPVEFDLTVEKGPSGAISGSAMLTKVQIDSLKRGWFYVQIHAEKAPDGNLWGWLLPQSIAVNQ